MKKNLKQSRKNKTPPSYPRDLTKEEIEDLRRDRQETHEWAQKALDKMGIKPLD